MEFKEVMQGAHQICQYYLGLGTCYGCPFRDINCSMLDFGEPESVTDENLQKIEEIIKAYKAG